MSEFALYFKLGYEHILAIDGYDHIMFVLALCAIYSGGQWRNILVLVTAFTIGHSITLALSALNFVSVNTELIEFLIPLTIFITALSNIIKIENGSQNTKIWVNYVYALFFGLIHGLGFSNCLKALLGKSANIVHQLLAFNLGLEFGQVLIVLVYLGITFLFLNIINLSKSKWALIVSAIVMGVSITLMIETKFW